MDKILESINNEDNKKETLKGLVKLGFVTIIIIILLFSAGMVVEHQRNNYMNIVYLNDGSVYNSSNHKIIINDGYSVIIDGEEYLWYWVDHIKLYQKKGE